MERNGLRTGHLLALAGALATLAALWMPWYRIDLGDMLHQVLGGPVGQDPGLLGQMARGLASAAPQHVSATGWQALRGADVALCVLAVLVLALACAAARAFGDAVRVDAATGAQLIAGAGVAIAAVAGYHLVRHPGGAAAAGVIHTGSGILVAIAGGIAVMVGGLMAATPDGSSRPAAAPAAFTASAPLPTAAAPGSVPPPSS